MCLWAYAHSKSPDQPAHPYSLIRAFIVLFFFESLDIVKYIHVYQRPLSGCAVSLPDLDIYCSHLPWRHIFLPPLPIWDRLFAYVRNFYLARLWSRLAVPRNNPLKGGRKRINHELVHAGYGNLTLSVGISTRDEACLVPGWNSYP